MAVTESSRLAKDKQNWSSLRMRENKMVPPKSFWTLMCVSMCVVIKVAFSYKLTTL